MSKHERVNHSNQLNPNNKAYWEARGCDQRPDDWGERVAHGDGIKQEEQNQANIKCGSKNVGYPASFDEWFGKTMGNSRCSTIDDDE